MTKKRKVQSPQERRRIRLLQELTRIEKAKDADEDLEDEIVDEIDDDEDVVEESPEPVVSLRKELDTLEKDMMGPMSDSGDMPMPTGPTSFDELDAARAAQEQADEIQDASCDARSLVANILNHPMMSPKEKAGAIKDVGTGFEKRISTILTSPPDSMQKDLDILALESIIEHDKRQSSIAEQWIDKAKVSYASRQDMPDENFALVVTRNGKKIRKYLIHDKAHVRNALARAAQQMQAGGEGASDAKAAMPKIRAAAKKFGIEMSMKKDRNAIIVEKDATGTWRWIGWVSNNFQDTDGDIISKEAHEKYIAFLDANPQMAPTFLTWHTPGTMRKSLPDFWSFENGFLMMSGPLTDGEAELLLKAGKAKDLGMSHGTLVFGRDANDARVVTDYLMYEVSDLPLENAANPFTALETLSKEVGMNKTDYLAQFVGKERAEELVQQTAAAQKELKEAGVLSKEAAAPATPEKPEPKVPVTPELMEHIMKELDVEGLSEFVAQAKEAFEKVEVLEAVVKELTTGEDARLAEKIEAPVAKRFAWSEKARPSERDDNVVKEDDKLLKNKPETGWLSEATGTKPVAAPQVN